MSIDTKELKKLADACRKAGIKHFKNAEVEFTLSDDLPQSNYKKKQVNAPATGPDQITGDSLTEQELLFWSTGIVPTENQEQ